MPLTALQHRILGLLASAPPRDSYLAGGAALHFTPQSKRFSEDLDFFHDSEKRVAETFAADRALLEESGYAIAVELSQPGFIRAVVSHNSDSTRIDWAHDSAWRFMPLVADPLGGLLLHPVDLAINKVLALAGRDEARDYVDILHVHQTVLPLAGLVWAAVGKDPGLTPASLLELLKRRGRPRPEEVDRLHLSEPFDSVHAKSVWLDALADAERFIADRPAEEIGCLYYSSKAARFVLPNRAPPLGEQGIVTHFGTPGGGLPRVV